MMSFLSLSVKRAFRSGFGLMLLFLVILITAAPGLGRNETLPPAGVCISDKGVISERISKHLSELGFELCQSEEIMRKRISSGEYDCGAVIPEGFGEKLASGMLDEAVLFITSPTSFAPDVYQNQLSAAIFAEYAPYITAEALSGMEITAEEALEAYRQRLDGGQVFSFDIVYSGTEEESAEPQRASAYTLAAASLMIFAVMSHSCCGIVRADSRLLSKRIGGGRMFVCSVLPDLGVRVIGVILACGVAVGLSGVLGGGIPPRLLLAIALYTLAVTVFTYGAAVILRTPARLQFLSFFVILASLVLCPIYLDVSLFLPWIGYLRAALPTYWLWLFAGI